MMNEASLLESYTPWIPQEVPGDLGLDSSGETPYPLAQRKICIQAERAKTDVTDSSHDDERSILDLFSDLLAARNTTLFHGKDIPTFGRTLSSLPVKTLKYGCHLHKNAHSKHQFRDAAIDLTAECGTWGVFARLGGVWPVTIGLAISELAGVADDKTPSLEQHVEDLRKAKGPLEHYVAYRRFEAKAVRGVLSKPGEWFNHLWKSLSKYAKSLFNKSPSVDRTAHEYVHQAFGGDKTSEKKFEDEDDALVKGSFLEHVCYVQKQNGLTDQEAALYFLKARATFQEHFQVDDSGHLIPLAPKVALQEEGATTSLKAELATEQQELKSALEAYREENAQQDLEQHITELETATKVFSGTPSTTESFSKACGEIVTCLDSVAIITTVLGAPQAGKQIEKAATGVWACQRFVNSASDLGKALSKVGAVSSKGSALSSMASILGGIGGIVGALSTVISLFGEDEASALQQYHEQTMKALETLQENLLQQMFAYHEEVMAGFKHVQYRLDMQERALILGFHNLARQNQTLLRGMNILSREIEVNFARLQDSQFCAYQCTRDKLLSIEQTFPLLVDSNIQRKLTKARSLLPTRLDQPQFVKTITNLFTIATTDACQPLLTGATIESLGNASDALSKKQHVGEQNINLLSKLIPHLQDFSSVAQPNPILWAFAVNALVALVNKRLEQRASFDKEHVLELLRELVTQGEALQKFLEKLSGSEVLESLLEDCLRSSKRLVAEVQQAHQHYEATFSQSFQERHAQGKLLEETAVDRWNPLALAQHRVSPHFEWENTTLNARKYMMHLTNKRPNALLRNIPQFQSEVYHPGYGWYPNPMYSFPDIVPPALYGRLCIVNPESSVSMHPLLVANAILIYRSDITSKWIGDWTKNENWQKVLEDWLSEYEKIRYSVTEQRIEDHFSEKQGAARQYQAQVKQELSQCYQQTQSQFSLFEDFEPNACEQQGLIYPSRGAQEQGATICLPLSSKEGATLLLPQANDQTKALYRFALKAEHLGLGKIRHEYTFSESHLIIATSFAMSEAVVPITSWSLPNWQQMVSNYYPIDERLWYVYEGGQYQKPYDLAAIQADPENALAHNGYYGQHPGFSFSELQEVPIERKSSEEFLTNLVTQAQIEHRRVFAESLLKDAQNPASPLCDALLHFHVAYQKLYAALTLAMPVVCASNTSLQAILEGTPFLKNKDSILEYLDDYRLRGISQRFLQQELQERENQLQTHVRQFEERRQECLPFMGRPDVSQAMRQITILYEKLLQADVPSEDGNRTITIQHPAPYQLENAYLMEQLKASQTLNENLIQKVDQLQQQLLIQEQQRVQEQRDMNRKVEQMQQTMDVVLSFLTKKDPSLQES